MGELARTRHALLANLEGAPQVAAAAAAGSQCSGRSAGHPSLTTEAHDGLAGSLGAVAPGNGGIQQGCWAATVGLAVVGHAARAGCHGAATEDGGIPHVFAHPLQGLRWILDAKETGQVLHRRDSSQ